MSNESIIKHSEQAINGVHNGAKNVNAEICPSDHVL